jgi:hypothetical protein
MGVSYRFLKVVLAKNMLDVGPLRWWDLLMAAGGYEEAGTT